MFIHEKYFKIDDLIGYLTILRFLSINLKDKINPQKLQ